MQSESFLSAFLPSIQGRGPIGTAIRIAVKLHSRLFNGVSSIGKEGLGLGAKRKEEEMARKSIKVVDLLQHSAELGSTEALYTLGQISLVGHFFVMPDLFSPCSCSFLLLQTFPLIQNLRTNPSRHTQDLLAMHPRRLCWHSSTPLGITTLSQ
jgi:hypothetical protein